MSLNKNLVPLSGKDAPYILPHFFARHKKINYIDPLFKGGVDNALGSLVWLVVKVFHTQPDYTRGHSRISDGSINHVYMVDN
jgi:hypothetical protein